MSKSHDACHLLTIKTWEVAMIAACLNQQRSNVAMWQNFCNVLSLLYIRFDIHCLVLQILLVMQLFAFDLDAWKIVIQNVYAQKHSLAYHYACQFLTYDKSEHFLLSGDTHMFSENIILTLTWFVIPKHKHNKRQRHNMNNTTTHCWQNTNSWPKWR